MERKDEDPLLILEIYEAIKEGPKTYSEIAEIFEISDRSARKQVLALDKLGKIRVTRMDETPDLLSHQFSKTKEELKDEWEERQE